MTPDPIHARDSRPDVYFEGDVMIIRGSSFGRNLCSLVRAGIGMPAEPPPAMMLEKFDEGSRAEPYLLRRARDEFGWAHFITNDYARQESTGQIEVELWVGKKVCIRIHPDDVVVKGGVKRVLEAKALARGSDLLSSPGYRWQMSCEMAATGLGGLWVVGTKTKCPEEVGDDQCSKCAGLGFTLDVAIEEVDTPYFTPLEIKKRALEIYRLVTTRAIPECESRQWPCGYYTDPDAMCSREYKGPGARAEYVELRDADRVKLEVLLTRWRMLKHREGGLKKDIDDVRKEISALTVGIGVGKAVLVDEVEVRWKPGRAGSVDWAKVPDALEAQVKAEEYRKPDGKPYVELTEKRKNDGD